MRKTILKLILELIWFLEIRDKDKREEYREITPYYVSLLFNWKKSGLSKQEFADRLKKEGNVSELWKDLKFDLKDKENNIILI